MEAGGNCSFVIVLGCKNREQAGRGRIKCLSIVFLSFQPQKRNEGMCYDYNGRQTGRKGRRSPSICPPMSGHVRIAPPGVDVIVLG